MSWINSLKNHSPISPLREPLKVIVNVLDPNVKVLNATAAAMHNSNQLSG